jgi:hypothetical protein
MRADMTDYTFTEKRRGGNVRDPGHVGAFHSSSNVVPTESLSALGGSVEGRNTSRGGKKGTWYSISSRNEQSGRRGGSGRTLAKALMERGTQVMEREGQIEGVRGPSGRQPQLSRPHCLGISAL